MVTSEWGSHSRDGEEGCLAPQVSLTSVHKLCWLTRLQKPHYDQWLNVHRYVAVLGLRHSYAN